MALQEELNNKMKNYNMEINKCKEDIQNIKNESKKRLLLIIIQII